MGDREKHLDLPPPPPFPTSVRLATLDDLPRLAFVAAAGFYHSQFFAFQRPRFNEYPKDTLANYKDQCLTHIVDPSQILLVAEADYDENEGEAVNQILRDADASAGLPEQRAGHPGKVIVGYAVILLKNDVKRIGTFQTCDLILENLKPDPGNLRRDMGTGQGLRICLKVESEQHWVFEGRMDLARLAVHPAYWRRGHAKRLVQWWVDLADHDGVQACVSAANMGKFVYQSVGFKQVAIAECHGYEEHPDPIVDWFGLRPRLKQS